jgi:tetratricopeptide (TPR) repeat protein
MRKSSSIALIALLCIFSTVLPMRGDDLEQARDRFAHGENESAVTFFEKHLQSARPSSSAYYELGQALQKSEKEAEAALAYRRALLLDPRFAPAAEALRQANARLGVSPSASTWQARWAEKVPSDPTVLFAAVAFWFGAFLLLAALALSKKRTLLFSLASVLLLVGLASCILAAFTDPRILEARQAMVMILSGTSLYKVPSEDAAEKITTLNQGSTVKILSARGRWFHVELPGGQRGWFLQEGITPVIPSA